MTKVDSDMKIIKAESNSYKALSLETKSSITNLIIFIRPGKLLFAIRGLH